MRYAVRVRAQDGAEGQYVTHWVGTHSALGQTNMLAPALLGRNAEHRELIYDELKREARAYDHMGHGPLDIALWDLVGKKYGISVPTMLGAYKQRLPTYASTHHGQDEPGGLDSIEAFGDFAAECRDHGFPAFKIHGWHDGDKRRESAVVLKVRQSVGDTMEVMVDPGCELRTWADALYVGRACDEAACLWYEDPYRDASTSVHGQLMLRQKLKTPLLVSEHIRGPEQKASFALAGGCDMISHRSRIRSGHHRADEDRPYGGIHRHGHSGPRLRPRPPRLRRRHPQHALLRTGVDRSWDAEPDPPGLYLRLFRPAGSRGPRRLRSGADRPGVGRGVRLGLHPQARDFGEYIPAVEHFPGPPAWEVACCISRARCRTCQCGAYLAKSPRQLCVTPAPCWLQTSPSLVARCPRP